jgi:anoctamin-10
VRGESFTSVQSDTNDSVLDKAHNLPPRPVSHPTTPATKLRLLYSLLTAPPIQNGLGITPGIGEWSRVKSIMALHDDQADKEWVSRWAGGDWKIGLLTGLSGQISQDVSLPSPCPLTNSNGIYQRVPG